MVVALKPTIELTDKSMPAVKMTRVIPKAIMPSSDICCVIKNRLSHLRNAGDVTAIMAINAMSITNSKNSNERNHAVTTFSLPAQCCTTFTTSVFALHLEGDPLPLPPLFPYNIQRNGSDDNCANDDVC